MIENYQTIYKKVYSFQYLYISIHISFIFLEILYIFLNKKTEETFEDTIFTGKILEMEQR